MSFMGGLISGREGRRRPAAASRAPAPAARRRTLAEVGVVGDVRHPEGLAVRRRARPVGRARSGTDERRQQRERRRQEDDPWAPRRRTELIRRAVRRRGEGRFSTRRVQEPDREGHGHRQRDRMFEQGRNGAVSGAREPDRFHQQEEHDPVGVHASCRRDLCASNPESASSARAPVVFPCGMHELVGTHCTLHDRWIEAERPPTIENDRARGP